MSINLQSLSKTIENILVARNLRGMKDVQPTLQSGYYLRAATLLKDIKGHVLIGTGFPVVNTFETDGPVGAIALYEALEKLGITPIIVGGDPMASAIAADYNVHAISVGEHSNRQQEASDALAKYQPQGIISIERPGQAADGGYYNMRGECITPRAACFDAFLQNATCPTIAIGDGGNEIGMGNIHNALEQLSIVPSVTTCDELLIADVSNWGAYGLIAFLSVWHQQDLLAEIDPVAILQYLSERGSVDGVTRLNELTEDGLAPQEGLAVIQQIRQAIGYQ